MNPPGTQNEVFGWLFTQKHDDERRIKKTQTCCDQTAVVCLCRQHPSPSHTFVIHSTSLQVVQLAPEINMHFFFYTVLRLTDVHHYRLYNNIQYIGIYLAVHIILTVTTIFYFNGSLTLCRYPLTEDFFFRNLTASYRALFVLWRNFLTFQKLIKTTKQYTQKYHGSFREIHLPSIEINSFCCRVVCLQLLKN